MVLFIDPSTRSAQRNPISRELTFLVWLLAATLGGAQTAPPPRTATNSTRLTQVQQVRTLTPAEAALKKPVHLQGVITCIDLSLNLCFLQDETGGVYVFLSSTAPALADGQLVEIQGISNAGRYAPIVIPDKIQVLGTAPKPKAIPISINRLASGTEDSQWVEVEGVVHLERENWGNWFLDLVADGYRFQTRILKYSTNQPLQLTDAKLRIRGVATASLNNDNQLVGFCLMAPSMDDVTVLSAPASHDPYEAPKSASRDLFSFSQAARAGHRVLVQGVVQAYWPDLGVFLRDQSGGFNVRTRQKTAVQPGDVVEASGFPAVNKATPYLEDAVFRKIGGQSPPLPIPIAIEKALANNYENELVQLDAVLVEKQPSSSTKELIMILENNHRQFKARLLQADMNTDMTFMPNGSRVRLCGIFMTENSDRQPASTFILHLRSSRDIQLIQRPTAWLLLRLIVALGALALAVFGGLFWMSLLRRKVRQQTALVRAREAALEARYQDLFENANDILYSHDPEGRITSLNHAGELLTGYNRQEASQLDIRQLVAPAARPALEQMLKNHRAGEARQRADLEILARSGRSLHWEVNTRLEYRDSQPSGVRGIARDITERKRLELQLHQSLQERERIAQDLHDDIIQSLYAAGLGLHECRRLVQENPEKAETQLQHSLQDLNRLIRKVRAFIVGMETEKLTGQDFISSLQSLLAIMGDPSANRFVLDVDPADAESLNHQQVAGLLLITREAISNSLRHAHARQTRISLQNHPEYLRLEITDDGVGFDPQARQKNGHGLRNIASRAQELDARYEIFSQPGQGTQIWVELPKNQTPT